MRNKVILGIGVDIVKNERFSKWLENPKLINRFFSEKETVFLLDSKKNKQVMIEYLASRFAAKEAFSKALGTGFKNFNLKDIYVEKDINGKPSIHFSESFSLRKELEDKKIHLSLSHEKEFSIAYVIIENK